MRKADSAHVRTAFKAEMSELLDAYRRTSTVLQGTSHGGADISRLASGTFLVSYVAFERFVSDLFLSYLNRDFSRYGDDLRARVLQSVEGKFKAPVRRRTRVRIPQHPSVAQVGVFVDADGRNLTFGDTTELKARAVQWLIPNHAGRITSLGKADGLLIDTAHSIRDFIGHRSVSSRQQMNEHLAELANSAAATRHLGRGVNEIQNIGSFLKATHRGASRLEGYVERLRDIAQSM